MIKKFKRDVREVIINLLDEKYKWVPIDDKTFVFTDVEDSENLEEFLDCVREKIGYCDELHIIELGDDTVILYVSNDDYRKELKEKLREECGFKTTIFPYLPTIFPSQIIQSDEFIREMEKRGWERVIIEVKRGVYFYENGGFRKGSDGEWYNDGISHAIRVRDGEILKYEE